MLVLVPVARRSTHTRFRSSPLAHADDNWLVDWAVHHEIETVDLSQTVQVIHQTGFDGNQAALGREKCVPHMPAPPSPLSPQPLPPFSRFWNQPLVNHHTDRGKPTHTRLFTSLTKAGVMQLEERFAWGLLRASRDQDQRWNVPNCSRHPTWRTCHGETE